MSRSLVGSSSSSRSAGLEHETRDQDARLLAAGEGRYGPVELAASKRSVWPSRRRESGGRERFTVSPCAEAWRSGLGGIETLARLVEVDDAATRGRARWRPASGSSSPANQAQKGGLAGAVAAQQPRRAPGVRVKLRPPKRCGRRATLGMFSTGARRLCGVRWRWKSICATPLHGTRFGDRTIRG